MSNKLYVVQVGYATFGEGDTEELAIKDALSNGMDAETTVKHYLGSRGSGPVNDCPGGTRASMTEFGELAHGDMIVIDREQAEQLSITL